MKATWTQMKAASKKKESKWKQSVSRMKVTWKQHASKVKANENNWTHWNGTPGLTLKDTGCRQKLPWGGLWPNKDFTSLRKANIYHRHFLIHGWNNIWIKHCQLPSWPSWPSWAAWPSLSSSHLTWTSPREARAHPRADLTRNGYTWYLFPS